MRISDWSSDVCSSDLVVELDNGASLDFYQRDGKISLQHYAFLIGDEEFDAVFARVTARGLNYWADPGKEQPQAINRYFGGRGFYFDDPEGHPIGRASCRERVCQYV